MTTWTTIYYEGTPDGQMEFQGPKVTAATEREAQIEAAHIGAILSDKWVAPPKGLKKLWYEFVGLFMKS